MRDVEDARLGDYFSTKRDRRDMDRREYLCEGISEYRAKHPDPILAGVHKSGIGSNP